MIQFRMFSVAWLACLVAACTSSPGPSPEEVKSSRGCADVVSASVTVAGDGTYRFDVTVASADTGWEKYADAWEVRTPDGVTLAVRELAHPHVDEQPFTRSLSGVAIPLDIRSVVIASRDSVEGFCGRSMTVPMP